MPNDLDARRRAIVRAFRVGGRASERPSDGNGEIKLLQETVTTLARRVDELTAEMRALQHGAVVRSAPPVVAPDEPHADEEPLGGRVSVPPITPARISNQAFDVLLGAVPEPARQRTG